jgi:N6-L-threonylcarbamoyladenine synthase
MRVLGIETSCDETAAAVVEDARTVLSDVVHSQTRIHEEYGGVVPELASRDHLMRALPVVERALADAGATLASLDGISVTCGPGLIGALLVGVQTAKALAFAAGKPVVGANHLEGHLLAIMLSERVPAFPFLGLVVSGGHTSLYRVDGFGAYQVLGQTRDDAAGEAFDKVGKLIGLPYPAGPHIDRLARGGNPKAIRFPRGLPRRGVRDFSFSGLKTAALLHVQRHGRPAEGSAALADFCASFQEAIVDVLASKAIRAARELQLERLVLCGGVAANSRLREEMLARGKEYDLDVFVPERKLCTDNGAMIAVAGTWRLRSGQSAGWDLNADAAWRI